MLHNQQKKRMERIEHVFNFLKMNSPKEIKVEEIIRQFDYISRRTLIEYLRTLHSTKRISYNENGWYVKNNDVHDKQIKNIFHRK